LIHTQNIIGQSIAIEELRDLIELVGPSESTVLILGDSGTGKELVARALHDASGRSDGPFIPVNCGAIPRELLESELFGHRRGSFTGAISDRKGRFELANNGTLFLDEIGDMPIDLQVKLLRVLQERQIDPIGSLTSVPINVRVLAATHKDIVSLMDQSLFREDLYYRLNVMPIEIQPLTDRKEDVLPLFDHFAAQHASDGKPPITLHPFSMALFLEYSWPGNVRELANLVDRYSALYAGQEVDLRKVIPSMVPPGIRALANVMDPAAPIVDKTETLNSRLAAQVIHTADAFSDSENIERYVSAQMNNEVEQTILLAQGGGMFPEEGVQLKQHLLDIERNLIRHALASAEGNVSKTARLLNLQRTTLIEKISKHGLSSDV